MNSLYGRFGMNPESTVTEICNQKRYEELMKMDNYQSAEKLTDHYYIVNYITNSSFVDDDDWKAPKMSAVQLAAAITACARIHMYPHMSRPDCYYTDTDSIVLGSPLSDDLISSVEMGKFKFEYHVKRGIFLAPKSYLLDIEDDRHVIKHKGPAKDLVTSEWFQKQFADPFLPASIRGYSRSGHRPKAQATNRGQDGNRRQYSLNKERFRPKKVIDQEGCSTPTRPPPCGISRFIKNWFCLSPFATK